MTDHNEAVKTVADGVAVMTVLGTLNAWRPPIASLFTIIWMATRIWESDTVRGLTNRREKPNALDE
jgi:hypothetical protein